LLSRSFDFFLKKFSEVQTFVFRHTFGVWTIQNRIW
jgi:hypothetical protein